ncbi:hypothetical protein Ciccas_010754 [Cichlidogyrus casuarinus]|uniref:polynucleotide adenylyltransferase n=1 Tax=Cichlidogyrus casuarinus TaxID=1844966 RepID=A0ABD2PU14_9PLAT
MKSKAKEKSMDSNRFHVLSFDQIERIHQVIESRIPITPKSHDLFDEGPLSWPSAAHRSPVSCHGIYDNYPTVHVKVRDMIKSLKDALREQQILVKEVRINGSAAGFIIDVDSMQNYSDIDLIFSVDLSDSNTYAKIKSTVLETMSELLATNAASGHASYSHGEEIILDSKPLCKRTNFCSVNLSTEPFVMKQYVRKMVRVNKPSVSESDSWSLISLGYQTPNGGKTVELKFVHKMRRPFEFTVDSFQIVTDTLFQFYEQERTLSKNLYPAVVAESVSGSFSEALYHLKHRIIATHNPEEIRGGGLLKYCKLLVEGYQPTQESDILSLERYMCSRFFIDFPTVTLQYSKLVAYLSDHFSNNDDVKVCYLKVLYSHSTTLILINHTLNSPWHPSLAPR